MSAETKTKVDLMSAEAPTADFFRVESPLLSKGESTEFLAGRDGFNIHIKVFTDGGENHLHAHGDEVHAFIVLAGEATFYDKDDTATVMKPFDGAFIPANTLYKLLNSGEGNMVCLRIGQLSDEGPDSTSSSTSPTGAVQFSTRLPTILAPDGSKAPIDYYAAPGIPIPGKFFGRE